MSVGTGGQPRSILVTFDAARTAVPEPAALSRLPRHPDAKSDLPSNPPLTDLPPGHPSNPIASPGSEPQSHRDELPHPGLQALGPFPSERAAREAALVLASMSIGHSLQIGRAHV